MTGANPFVGLRCGCPACDPDRHAAIPEVPATRRFTIQRDVDVTGLSGTGPVADGVQFPDGTTVVRWRELPDDHEHYRRGVRATTVVFESARAVEALHGHGGATRLVWHDPEGDA